MDTVSKQKIEKVLNLFLNWNLGDVRKAAHLLPNTFEEFNREEISKIHPNYDGGAMVGATILAMCAIQSVAQFSLVHGDGQQFIWFVDNYMKTTNKKYDGYQMYALRCSLIKNYALVTRVGKSSKETSKIIGYALTNVGQHLHNSDFGKLLNFKQFMVDIQLATQKFFIDILSEVLPIEYANKITYYYDHQKIGPIESNEKSHL